MGEIYERMDNMLGEIKDIMATSQYKHEFSSMEQIVVTRWDKMTIPLHCLGFALTPRFYDHIYLETPAPGGFTRRAPNLDKEVVMGCMEAFGNIFHATSAVTVDAIDWWSIYGSQTPELAEVAKKVLSQPISSSSAERAWSTYGHVHSLKRNRLNSSRADKLVYIHTNLRLLSRYTDGYKNGPFRKWDIDPENSCLEESPLELEDMRWADLENDLDEEETLAD
ncbi:hypothetical protein V6N13_014549 [Hibiscus sabdariffa]